MIKALLVGIVLFLVFTFPATWLLMLFLGNLHLGLSYWGTLPLGIIVSLHDRRHVGPQLRLLSSARRGKRQRRGARGATRRRSLRRARQSARTLGR